MARILVVDDEPQLLKIMTRFLTKLGYGVVASGSTEDAWEHMQAAPADYTLALVDMTMPGMSAEVLIRKMLETSPALRVIAASGYPMTPTQFKFFDPGRVALLQKPFTPEELAQTVKSLLEAG